MVDIHIVSTSGGVGAAARIDAYLIGLSNMLILRVHQLQAEGLQVAILLVVVLQGGTSSGGSSSGGSTSGGSMGGEFNPPLPINLRG